MTFLSSPPAYPPSSSPPEAVQSRKRPNEERHLPAKKRLFNKDFVFPRLQGQKDRTDALKEILNVPAPVRDSGPANNPFEDKNKEEPSEVLADVDRENKQSDDFQASAITSESPNSPCVSFKSCLSSSGKRRVLHRKTQGQSLSYETLIAQRSTTGPDKVTRSYYGIDIHDILREAKQNEEQKQTETIDAKPQQQASVLPSVEAPQG